MRVRLDYGKEGLMAEIPDQSVIGILGLSPAEPIDDPSSAVEAALASPIGTQSLYELAKGKRTACVVICDITRPVPNRILLPPILNILERAEIQPHQITILIATGTHRPNVGAELAALVGEDIATRYRVVNHECHDDAAQVFIGTSPNGVPVRLDRTYCEADFRITVGLIEPHFMAGFSGGRKLIMPGIAAFDTVQRWHCPRFLESPMATNGSVVGNPVHEESLAIAKMVRPDLIVDVTLDEANRITGIFAGDLEEAWLKGVAFAGDHVRSPASAEADIVVTSCAGYPLDTTFYQAVKGMVGALPAVKDGGTIIIAAKCSEGVGSKDFYDVLMRTEDLEAFVEEISQPDVFVPEEWEVEELAKAVRKADVICVADGIDDEVLSRCFVTPAGSIEEALGMALARHGENATVIAIPRGPYVIPYVIAK